MRHKKRRNPMGMQRDETGITGPESRWVETGLVARKSDHLVLNRRTGLEQFQAGCESLVL
jgi:hypothetical protein